MMDAKTKKLIEEWTLKKALYDGERLYRQHQINELCDRLYINGYKKAMEIVARVSKDDFSAIDAYVFLQRGLEKLEKKNI